MRSNLNILRSLAALLVLAAHVTVGKSDRIGYISATDLGRLGVLLFFVHTCLVLMMSLERHRETASDFYIRRFFRIYPLSVVAILVVLLFHLPSNNVPGAQFVQPTIRELASNFLLAQNLTYDRSILGVLWSLPLEIQMYLVLPFFFRRTGKSVYFWLAVWLAAVIVGLLQPHLRGFSRLSVLEFAPNFIPGIIAFVLSKRIQPRLPSWAWLPFLASLTLLYPLEKHGYLTCLILGLSIPLFKDAASFVWLPEQIAKYSYGIYLVHVPILWLCPLWLALPLIAATSVACYHLIEKPMMDLGSKLTAKKSLAATA